MSVNMEQQTYNTITMRRRHSIDEHDMLEEENLSLNSEQGVSEICAKRNKREREEDESDWTLVSKGKKIKPESFKIEIYISSNEQMPKQFGLGRILKAAGIKDIERVKRINPFKVRLDVTNEDTAEKIENSTHLLERGWKIQRAMDKKVSHGVIKGIDLETSEEDILEGISCHKPAELISVSRLKRRNSEGEGWEPSEAVRLCFKGSFLPSFVLVHELRVRVESYVFPVTQCGKCWKLGHITKRCPSAKIVCPKCAEHHHNCETTNFKCANCSGRHMALARTCPAFLKEKRLRELMAEYNCTYRQALTLYVPPSENGINTSDMKEVKTKNQTNTPIPIQNAEETPITYDKERTYAKVTTRAIIHENAGKKYAPNPSGRQQSHHLYQETESDYLEGCSQDNTKSQSITQGEETKQENVKFHELLSRLREIVFLKGGSIKDKVHNVIKSCVEWLILLVVDNVTDWPILKMLLDYFSFSNG